MPLDSGYISTWFSSSFCRTWVSAVKLVEVHQTESRSFVCLAVFLAGGKRNFFSLISTLLH